MRRLPSTIAAALVGTLLLAGCGSPGSTGTATGSSGPSTSTSARAATSAAPAGKVGETVPLQQFASSIPAAMKSAGTFHAVGSGQAAIEADYDLTTDPMSLRVTMGSGAASTSLLAVGGKAYVAGAAFAAQAGGKKWLVIDPQGTDPVSMALAPSLERLQAQGLSPLTGISGLDATMATVSAVEGGVTTYRYTLTKDQVIEQLKASTHVGEDVIAALEASGQIGATSVQMSVDSEGRLTKVETAMGSATSTMTFSKFGEPVDIRAPAADEVGTL